MSNVTSTIYTAISIAQLAQPSSFYTLQMGISGEVFYLNSSNKWDVNPANAVLYPSITSAQNSLITYLQSLNANPQQPIIFPT